ncbi:uncharacterized protein LOC111570874 [Amphiprion ocellaris]|uniref:uncharacterized protein LOC111570874 n=1 Tax=Amphiprion ocellaris TaxID=80972 RepID=UPI002410C274|nr:uncharacterized protein LOC111570874 [Amphiprion ocellaris]
MLKFTPELIVHKGNIFYLLYVAGGLLMTVTAGGWCVDMAVMKAYDPESLHRLSNTFIGLLGLRHQIQATSAVKQKLKRLYFTESLSYLLDMTRISLRDTYDFEACWVVSNSCEQQNKMESTTSNWISTKRSRIYYILLCCGISRPILTLCITGSGSKMKTFTSSNLSEWLISFTRKAQSQGDVIFLLLKEQNGLISSGSDTNDATNDRYPTSLTLGLSTLCVVLFWTFLPHIAVCAAVCLGWRVRQQIRHCGKDA